MAKFCTPEEAAEQIKEGMAVMVGGFLNVGAPERILQALFASKVRHLTLIANDTGYTGCGVGLLQDGKQLDKVYTSYVGAHEDYSRSMARGEIEVVLTPQGTLAERIRSAGAGLGGFMTPTGVGTVVAEGKEEVVIDGKAYLLEYPLFADVALIKAYKADECGNLVYRRCAQNFNPLMATAAKLVIAEVDEIVAAGEIDPDEVMTPGIFVDLLVREGA